MRSSVLLVAVLLSAAAQACENAGTEHAAAVPSAPIATVDGRAIYGTPMPEQPAAIAVAQVLDHPAQYVDQTVKLSGRIGQVCQTKGCWMMLADGERALRVMFGKHAFFLPKDTRGNAIVYGQVVKVELDEAKAKHMAEDAGEDPAKVSGPKVEYRVVASSVAVEPAS